MPALVPISQYVSTLRNMVLPRAGNVDPPAPRFWDETSRLLGLFEQHRESDANANAAACFGGLARYRYDELLSRPKYDLRKKSIVSFFQPKSGGTFLHNRLLQLGYEEFWWMFPRRNSDTKCIASDEALGYFLRGGCACHSHALPEPNILAALDRAEVPRIWVHLRNPAETAVSMYHHLLGEGQGQGEIGEQRKQHLMLHAQRHGLAPGTTISEFVIHSIDWHIEWVVKWLSHARRSPGLFVISYHRELADLQGMFKRVFRELGARFNGSVSAEILEHDRFRQKASEDWRHELTSDAQKYIERRVRADLEDFPEFARLWR
jgi:hypothetical protein